MLAAIAVAVSCLACTDKDPTLAVPPPAETPHLLATVECSVDTRALSVVCTEPAPRTGDGPSLALLSSSAIKMRSANAGHDTVNEIFSMDATAQNLLSYSIGTPDGTTRTGLKVFFETGPTVTAYYSPGDTGTVTVRNPDGYQNFTGPQQPYHFYDTILAPQEITLPKHWEFNSPRTVARFGFTVRIFTTTPREKRVSQTPPDSIPSRYSLASSYRYCGISGLDTCVYDAIMVRFNQTATREERQSAVDMVGTLEGGIADLGIYLVRIARDTTLTRLRKALTDLRNLPQVHYAYPYGEIPGSSFYLHPDDGPDWNQWQLKDSLADGRNWALEAVSAPWSWGCETGTRASPLAIVDSDFHLVTDLAANATGQDSLVGQLTAAADTLDHGTFTASIAGAVGNNGAGMTGVAWQSSMRLYEVARKTAAGVVRDTLGNVRLSTARMAQQVARAARDGAPVVNLSMGVNWDVLARSRGWIPAGGTYDPATETNPTRQAQRDSIRDQLRDLMVSAVDEAVAAGFSPLVVIAAGNNGIDAGWNGFTQAATVRPGNVLVVAAGARIPGQRGLAPAGFTNYGTMVEIAAPGSQVWGLDRNGAKLGSGTSFAAPMVAAAAALLISYDPRLAQHPDTLKSLLLAGATQGGSRMRNGAATDTLPVLNVYESLKAAARRRGAPVCGNRIWSQGGALRVQRDGGVERLDSLPGYIRRFDAMHGGKRIRVLTVNNGQYRTELTYQNGAWVRGASVPYDSILSPIDRSGGGFSSSVRTPGLNPPYLAMFSHDGKSQVQLRTLRNGSGFVTGASLTLVDSAGARVVATIPSPISAGNGEVTECWIRIADTHDCVQSFSYIRQNHNAEITGALSPLGDSVYVAFRKLRSGGHLDNWEACPVPPAGDTIKDGWPDELVRECRPHISGGGSDSTWVYGLDLRAGTPASLLWLSGGRSLDVWGVTEDGSELVARAESSSWSDRILFYLYQPPGEPYWEMRHRYVAYTGSGSCELHFRSAQSGTVAYIPVQQPCSGLRIDGMGAPSVAPASR